MQKRRIYDITNVLEGIGLIVKYKKNKIRWNGQDSIHHKQKKQATNIKRQMVDNEMNEQFQVLKRELKKLQKHEFEIDKHIEHLENHKNELKMDHAYSKYAYVSYEDLDHLNRGRELRAEEDSDDERSSLEVRDEITGNSREMILAIRAPYGSTLEVPLES